MVDHVPALPFHQFLLGQDLWIGQGTSILEVFKTRLGKALNNMV